MHSIKHIALMSLIILGALLAPFSTFVSDASLLPRGDGRAEVVGESMIPFGFYPGDRVEVISAVPHVGDTIVFSCTLAPCSGYYIKKLTRQSDACYWVEGRRDIWTAPSGQKKYSIDSETVFNWLCSDDIVIHGIVPERSLYDAHF